MNLLQSIILGIIQGATEFLPISSSGHLVLVPNLLGWEIPSDQAFAFNVFIQAATLVAVFSFFFKDLISLAKAFLVAIQKKSFQDPEAQLGLKIILATVPAGLVGLLFNGFFKEIYDSPKATAFFLMVTALLLVIAEKAGNRSRPLEEITWKDALWVGFFQVLALFPGISRSGTTITGGMLRNLDRSSSARFSFLISVPLMMAAGSNGFYKFIALPDTTSSWPLFFAGSLSAAVVGYFSIKWLLKFLNQRSLYTFSIYCVLFAGLNLLVAAIR